jgi:hypothetical protein
MTDLPSPLSIEDRLALLEAKLGVGVNPLALVPPITIGELTDVPAPGSQLAAQWAQEVSARVVQRFASKAAVDAWAASNGAFAVDLSTGIYYRRVTAGWAQVTPWQGTGTPAAAIIVGNGQTLVCNTLNIPTDPGPRVATLSSFTRLEKTNTAGVLGILYLMANGVQSTEAQVNTVHNDVGVPWGYHNVAQSANVEIAAGAAMQITVVVYSNIGNTVQVSGNPTFNRLTALVNPKGY